MIAHVIAALLVLQAPAVAPRTAGSPTATLIALDRKASAKLLAIAKGDADSDLRDAAVRQIAK